MSATAFKAAMDSTAPHVEQTNRAPPGVVWRDPDPLPDGLPPVESFEPAMLPASFRPWVEDIAERLQCAPDFPAVSAMVALAAVVGRQVGIRPKERDNWLVVPNVWGCIVGRPSVLKTPAITEATKPLGRLAARAREHHLGEVRKWEARFVVAKATSKDAKKEIAAVALEDRGKAIEMAVAQRKADDLERPSEPRYSTSDCTVEKLGELLRDNPRGLLIQRDELMGFLRALDKEGQESARAFYLEAWNGGGEFTYDRIGRGTVHIESATVSILGGTQPGPLTHYMRDSLRGGKGDDGLAQRFQLLAWPDFDSCRLVDRWPDTNARNVAYEVFTRLDTINAEGIEATCDPYEPIPFVHFDGAAQELFNDWYITHKRRLLQSNLPGCLEAHLAKYASLIPTLSLVIHLADIGYGPVTRDALERACAWGEYLESHARRLYAPAIIGEDVAARELAKRILAKDLPDGFSLRQVYRKGWTGLATLEDAEAALRVLVDLGGLAESRLETGGRPSTCFWINPRIREVWAP